MQHPPGPRRCGWKTKIKKLFSLNVFHAMLIYGIDKNFRWRMKLWFFREKGVRARAWQGDWRGCRRSLNLRWPDNGIGTVVHLNYSGEGIRSTWCLGFRYQDQISDPEHSVGRLRPFRVVIESWNVLFEPLVLKSVSIRLGSHVPFWEVYKVGRQCRTRSSQQKKFRCKRVRLSSVGTRGCLRLSV